MKVSEVACRPVASCTDETSLSSAARVMGENDCGALPVLRDGRIVGILTDRDICMAIGKGKLLPAETPVKEVMSMNVATCLTTDDVGSALAIMTRRQVRRLPVLDPKGPLYGIVSLDDLILRAEESTPGGEPPPIAYRDLILALRGIVGKRPLRRSA
jgi:CBS domain-containing protein